MKTIKRYPNRKLYDTETSRYITLEEIAEHLRAGGEVRVVDSRTGRDITSVTLAQVLVGEQKRQTGEIPFQRLLALVQTGGEYLHRKIGTPVTSLKGEAERTVQRLMRGEPPEELREFIMATHRAYDDVQRRVDERLQVVLATVRNLSPVLKEIARVKDEVAALRQRVETLERQQGPAEDRGSPRSGDAGAEVVRREVPLAPRRQAGPHLPARSAGEDVPVARPMDGAGSPNRRGRGPAQR